MSDSSVDRRIISIILDNEAGALSRVAGLFSARGYNIESLTVAETDNPALSRMTIVTLGGDELIKQVVNQLNKIVDVAEVRDLSKHQFVEREILLAKVGYSNEDELAELEKTIKAYGATVIKCQEQICLFEFIAPFQQVEDLMQAINDWEVVEVARSGVVSLSS